MSISDGNTQRKSRADIQHKKAYRNSVHKWVAEAGLGLWVVIFLLIVFGSIFIFNIEQLARNMVLQYGAIGIFLFAILTDLLILPVGADVPLILGILLPDLNNASALILVLCASYIAMTIAYFIGRTAGLEGLERLLSKKTMKRITKIRAYRKYERWGMFIACLTPIPYIPYLAGVFKFSFLDMIKFMVIPRTLRYLIVFTLTITIGSDVLGFI
ncbi:MAG: VTT domain-containing protein [Nanoarchaeota archaeon]